MSRTEGAIAGLAAAGLGLTAGQVLGTLLDATSAPLVAVGSALIDVAPTPVKEWAVSTVGTADKPLLLVAVVIAVAGLGGLAGIVSIRRPLLGDIVFAALGLGGTLAALTRPSATLLDAIPSVLAAIVAAAVLRWQLRRTQPRGSTDELRGGIDRRLLLTGGAGVLGVLLTANLPAVRGAAPVSAPIIIPRPSSPASAFSAPARMRSSVDFPAPLGPTSASRSPRRSVSETPS